MSASTAWPSCPEQASAADAAPHWEAFFARLREHYPISEEAATRFKAAASVHRFEKGVKLLKPGVGVDFVMLLLSGSVEVSAQGVPCPLPYPYPYHSTPTPAPTSTPNPCLLPVHVPLTVPLGMREALPPATYSEREFVGEHNYFGAEGLKVRLRLRLRVGLRLRLRLRVYSYSTLTP